MSNSDVTTDATTTPTPAPKAKRPRRSNAVPKAIREASKVNAATLCRAISAHVGIDIDPKRFRASLRTRHGYVTGKVGDKLNLNSDKLLRSLIEQYSDKAKQSK
jgi:hypothetical protein